MGALPLRTDVDDNTSPSGANDKRAAGATKRQFSEPIGEEDSLLVVFRICQGGFDVSGLHHPQQVWMSDTVIQNRYPAHRLLTFKARRVSLSYSMLYFKYLEQLLRLCLARPFRSPFRELLEVEV